MASIIGTTTDDYLEGGSGNDYLEGEEGNDTLVGNAGDDSLEGDEGNDLLNGGAGNDTLEGGKGNDTLTGGDGSDVFVYETGDGNDRITDYDEDDLIYVDGTVSKITQTQAGTVILWVGSNKISVTGGSERVITYTDDDGAHTYPEASNSKLITLTEGDDSYSNNEDGVTIAALGGNDSIINNGVSVTVDGGAGNDTIVNEYGDGVSISSGVGNDRIYNEGGNEVSIKGGKGSDRISLSSYAENNVIKYTAGDGNDTVYGFNDDDTLIIGDGDGTYSTAVSGKHVVVTVGKGKVILRNAASLESVNINNLPIRNFESNVSISGTADDDKIYNEGDGATIAALGGNDSILNEGDNSVIDAGAGNDYIVNDGDSVSISGGKGDDTIVNDDDSVSISGGEGSDAIFNTGVNYSSIGGDDGDDEIYNNYGSNTTISGGAGNDTIGNHNGDEIVIDGGAGNDRIYNEGGNEVSIKGGKGSDRISLSSYAENNVIKYTTGDGNDTIYGFGVDETLIIGDGTYSTAVSGDHVVVTVGKGKIILRGAATLDAVNILGTAQSSTLVLTDEDAAKQTLAAGVEVADASARTAITRIVGNELDNSIIGGTGKDTIYGKDGNDFISGNAGNDKLHGQDGNDTLAGGKGSDSLTGGDGADVFYYTTGDGSDSITDYDEDDLIYIDGTVSSVTTTAKDNVILTVGSGRIVVADAADEVITYTDDTGTYTYPAVDNSVVFNDAGTAATLTAAYTADTFDAADYTDTLKTVDASAVTHDLTITGNKLANRIIGTEDDDFIDGAAGKDTILGGDGNDTIHGGTGNDVLRGGDGENVFVFKTGEGSNRITDYKSSDTIFVTSGTAADVAWAAGGGDAMLTIGTTKVTLTGGADKYIHIVDGDGNEQWYPYLPPTLTPVIVEGNTLTLTEYYIADYFDAADYDSVVNVKNIDASAVMHDIAIVGDANKNSIVGSTQNDFINGGSGNDTIDGGEGDDSIQGGKGTDKLTGGDGSDVFYYSTGDGNDRIQDYNEDDLIYINGTVSKITQTSAGTVILWVGSQKISVVGGSNKIITYVDDDGTRVYPSCPYTGGINEAGTSVTLGSNYIADTFDVNTSVYVSDYAGTLKTIDASAVTHDLSITGNNLANRIIAGEGDDTLIGGKGNDTLYGGEGDDVFVYNAGDGNDVIADYQESDVIRITGNAGVSVSNSGGDVIMRVGSNTIRLKDAADDNTVVNYYENGSRKRYIPALEGSNDLLADDNYSTNAAQVAAIAEPFKASYMPYDFEAAGFGLVKQPAFATAITFTDKK